jgi:hypothetical protein
VVAIPAQVPAVFAAIIMVLFAILFNERKTNEGTI